MRIGQKQKPNYAFWVFLLLAALYIGYCMGTLEGHNLTIDTILSELKKALLNPLPMRITGWTGKGLLFAGLIWLMAFLYYLSSVRNFMPGREYGAARIASPQEINRVLEDKKTDHNKILSEHLRMSTNDQETRRNNNVLVIGGAGTGKTQFFTIVNILKILGSYVITDPKGEILKACGKHLKKAGVQIKVLNLVDMESSDQFNPFAYLIDGNDVIRLITNLIANTTPKGTVSSTDPFWEKSEAMLLQAIFYYVWKEFPMQDKTPNFRGVLELLNEAKVSDSNNVPPKLSQRMNKLPEDHIARITYEKVFNGAEDTIRSIVISAQARLSFLQNEKILRILDDDNINLASLGTGRNFDGESKTALFAVIPDNDKSYNFVVGMLYTLLFQELYFQADHRYDGRLPIPVMLWMDEFPNVALPDDFCSLLSTMRSRGISCNIIIQNMAQIKALFEKTWETIEGNCDALVYLGGNERSTHEYISKTLGNWTIDKRSNSRSFGSHGSTSRSEDILGREIMRPEEIRKMPNSHCLVTIRGLDPVYDLKYQTFQKPEYKACKQLGDYIHTPVSKQQEKVSGNEINMSSQSILLNETSVDYYKRLEAEGEPVTVWEFTEEELLSLDPRQLEWPEEPLSESEREKWIADHLKELRASFDEAKKMQSEIKEYELEIKNSEDTLANRFKKYDYSQEQLEELRLGIEHGLPKEVLLSWFHAEWPVETMRTLRLLSERQFVS